MLSYSNRFAKRDYAVDGALLEALPLADCMRTVFTNPESGRSRLDHIPLPIPRPLIAFTYCLVRRPAMVLLCN